MNENTTNTNQNRDSADTSERMATCALIAGITALISSFQYLPAALTLRTSIPIGLICGVIAIVMAILSKQFDLRPRKSFRGKAVVGIILGAVAIGLTLFFFFVLVSYYNILNDPVAGPQFNEMIRQIEEQLQMQLNL